ncbi:MAG: hypothetical protein HZB16_18125 [Armatimonadetes bacterium]|nr:hypothetical protein [Armatimonadota bacterium]
MRVAGRLLAMAVLLAAPLAAQESYHLEVARVWNAVQTYEQTLTRTSGEVRQVDLYMAVPPALPNAQESIVRKWWLDGVAIEPQRAACSDPVDRLFGNTILTYRLPYLLGDRPATVKVTTFARLTSTRLAAGPPTPAQTMTLTDAERRAATQESGVTDYSQPAFQAWYRALGLNQRPAGETDRGYVARAGVAIGRWFRAGHTDAGGDGWKGSAVVTRRQLNGTTIAIDCVPTAVLLATLLRAPKDDGSQIPAVIANGWLVDKRLTATPVGHALVRYWDATAQAWLWADMTAALRPEGDLARPEPTLRQLYDVVNQQKDILIEELGGGVRPEPSQPVYDGVGPLTTTYRFRGAAASIDTTRQISFTELR